MIAKFLLGVGLVVLMVVSSFSTYMYLGGRQSKVAIHTDKPTVGSPRQKTFTLPGTLYLAQSGAIYSLSIGKFHQLTSEDGWTQPFWNSAGNNIVLVHRTDFYSDVYLINRFGQIGPKLTSNGPPGRSNDTTLMHWSFYPRITPDNQTLFMSYDEPKFGYDVPFSIWSLPVGGTTRQGKLWTNANDYTGGDIQPLPTAGGIMYTKYGYGPDGNLVGQIWFTTHPTPSGREGKALTSPEEDCHQPSISPDGSLVAMICTYEKQISQLTIASWDGSNLGPRRAIITDQLVSQPAWAPDGSGIAYLAPATTDSFQLWFLPKNAYNPPAPSPTPVPSATPGGPYNGTLPSPTQSAAPPPPVVKPIQITTNSAFDATSPIAWGP